MTAGVQYGPVASAGMVHLNQQHMLPVQRTAAVGKLHLSAPRCGR